MDGRHRLRCRSTEQRQQPGRAGDSRHSSEPAKGKHFVRPSLWYKDDMCVDVGAFQQATSICEELMTDGYHHCQRVPASTALILFLFPIFYFNHQNNPNTALNK